uniref:Peroxisomal membrane protein PEX16 n=1 Tax=Graphocephala atropunctata TaxID=36148 RepID=A0A1B6LMU6_9HEMI
MTLPHIKAIFERYVEWVSANPQTTSEIECLVKWISYFVAGRISNSAVISELVYSVSNLLVLVNDNIIRKSQPLHTYGSADRLKTWLTVLDYSEVFIEVSVSRTWGEAGRWIVIVLVQIFKCIARLSLLYRYKENIVQNPPVVPLKRSEINNPVFEVPPEGFALKSGRVIRTVDAATPLMYRTWKPPVLNNHEGKEDAVLSPTQFLGEVIYITKPLAHLAALYRCGPQNWKPWILAFAMDILSLQLVKGNAAGSNMSRRQSLELSRRQVSLLLYLLRSPFYERQTRDRLQRLVTSCCDSVPFISYVLKPLAEYIPHWQHIYFYMWSA